MVEKRTLRSPAGGEPFEMDWPLTQHETIWVLDLISFAGEEFPKLKVDVNVNISGDDSSVDKLFDQFNTLVFNSMMTNRTKNTRAMQKKRATKESLKSILELVYSRAVKNPLELNNYKQFSSLVYGETSYELMCDIVDTIQWKDNDIFIDLGCGIGQIVLQIAAATNCKMCYGVEKSDAPSSYMTCMDKTYKSLMQWFGLTHGQYELLKGDFLDEEYRDKFKSSTVVFSNNILFGPELNYTLGERLATLDNDTMIVSSCCFASRKSRKLTERNSKDISSILQLEKILMGKVSWTNRKVEYYIQRVDRKNLYNFLKTANVKVTSQEESCRNSNISVAEPDADCLNRKQIECISVPSALQVVTVTSPAVQAKDKPAPSALQVVASPANQTECISALQKVTSPANQTECISALQKVTSPAKIPLRQIQPEAGDDENHIRSPSKRFKKTFDNSGPITDEQYGRELSPEIDLSLDLKRGGELHLKLDLERRLERSPETMDFRVKLERGGKMRLKLNLGRRRELSPERTESGPNLERRCESSSTERNLRPNMERTRELSPETIELDRAGFSAKISWKSRRELSPDIIDLSRVGSQSRRGAATAANSESSKHSSSKEHTPS